MPLRIPILLALLAASASAREAAYVPKTGTHPINTVRFELPRGEKEKPLRVRATYPALSKDAKAQAWPVIVYSHGMFGSGDAYDPLVTAWAKSGFVVLQPTHPDSAKLGVRSRAQAQRAWRKRPLEVRFLLDSLDTIEKKLDGLRGTMDRKRIGMGGHSFGCHTSMLITGVKPRIRLGLSDKRVRCAYLISPQGKGPLFLETAWSQWRVPAVIVTGDNDGDPFGNKNKGPLWRLDPFRFAPPQDKYLLWIDGAHHNFGGITGRVRRGAGPKNDKHVAKVRDTGLAFFDAYLRGNKNAKAWLAANMRTKQTK